VVAADGLAPAEDDVEDLEQPGGLGRIGRFVTCAIYGLRPRGCRLIEPGDERCLQYRRERGIDR